MNDAVVLGRRISAILRPNQADLNDGIFRVPFATCGQLRLPVLGLALLLGLSAPAGAGPYVLMEAESGKVIAQHDAGLPWYPASVTKLMTTYLTFRAMREGKLRPNSLLTVSETAVAQGPSKMGFKAGTQLTVDNALKMLMVKSANDIAVVLAEGVSGTLPAFIEEMNRVADEIGMSGTHFVNPNGLPEDGQVTTARDMAILARAIIREYPEHEMLFRIPAIRLGKRLLRNHNNKLLDHYPGTDGMKTGFICSSGFNVVASAKRGDKRLVVVVFGAYSSGQRADDAARLFERGFQPRFSLATLFMDNRPTIDMIANVSGMPADLREMMCNRKRKRPAAESDIEDDEEVVEEDPGSARTKGASVKEKGNWFVDLPPSMPPIQVYVGSSPPPPEKATATRKTKTAEKPDDGKKPVKKRKAGKKKE